jgi:transposase
MGTSKSGKVVFKPYQPNQPTFLPPSLDELLAPDHVVRVVNEVIDRMNIDPLLDRYPGGGASSYHPKMLLKVLVYAYTQRIYSSRQISKALREQIPFMWLAGGNRPDFRTINRFRSSRLKGTIEEVFASLLELCFSEGLLREGDVFVDGTKIEANANKFTYVWKKSTKRYKRLRQEKIKRLLDAIDDCNEEEERRYGERDLEELGEESTLTSHKVAAKVKELDERLRKKAEEDKTVEDRKETRHRRTILRQVKEKDLPKLKDYEHEEETYGERNSFSRTDPDATFMRMKEDRMQGGELKAGYNVQLSTSDQIIVGFTAHQRPGDSPVLRSHLERIEAILGKMPSRVIADAGYGSEENYAFLEEEDIDAYVKYNTFDQERKRSFKDDPYQFLNWSYDEKQDTYTCPEGRLLRYRHNKESVSENGYISERRVYQSETCCGCPVKEKCMPRGNDRKRVVVGEALARFRKRAYSLLESEEGKRLRAKRSIDVESVFGHIKGCRGFRRFHLRGLEKVTVELGLLAMAHNLLKWWTKRLSLLFLHFREPKVASLVLLEV